MIAKVLQFPEATTAEQALMEALEMAQGNDLQDVLIVGHDGGGYIVIMASGSVTGKDALWMLEMAKLRVLGADV